MESAKKLHGGLLLTDDKNLLVSHIVPALGHNFVNFLRKIVILDIVIWLQGSKDTTFRFKPKFRAPHMKRWKPFASG